MNRKSLIIVLLIILSAAIMLGLLLVNKGDGPVAGMILSGTPIEKTEDYKNHETSSGADDFLIETMEFNRFKIRSIADIAAGKDIYANIHLVECPKGSEFTAKWSIDGAMVKEETKRLSTDQQGVIAYFLESGHVKRGNCRIELYSGMTRIFEGTFLIK